MASGNSGGSIQSSSSGGGDEEYDSRTQSISSNFFNKPSKNFASFLPHDQNQSSTYYSSHLNNIPSAQNLHPYPPSSAPSFHYNINVGDAMIWPAGLRSEANSTTEYPLRNQSLVSSQPNAVQPDVTKNPKKRTRASRRAPTTVLTTDAANFRQMVQEFTGIPTTPFPGTPYARRMNLLSGAGAHVDGLGPLYSLRPTLQNIAPPFSSSSSPPSIFNATMIDAIVSTTNIVITGNKTGTTPAVACDLLCSNNSPLHPDQGLLNLQHDHLHPSFHGHRTIEPSGSISFGDYPSDFRNQDQIITSAAAGDFKINNDNITVWGSDGSAKNDDGIQEKFMPFDGKI